MKKKINLGKQKKLSYIFIKGSKNILNIYIGKFDYKNFFLIITIVKWIIKLLNIENILDDFIDELFINENEKIEESNSKSENKSWENNTGKLICKLIIGIGIISWFQLPADQSSYVLIAFILSELIDNITEKLNEEDSIIDKEEEESKKKDNK